MPVYQVHTGPNLLAWADRTVPFTTDAQIAGERDAFIARTKELNLEKLDMDLKQARLLYPLELNVAKAQADLAELNLERNKIFYSTERIKEMAHLQAEQERLKLDQVTTERRRLQVQNVFNKTFAPRIAQAKLTGDMAEMAKLIDDAQLELGDDFHLISNDITALIDTLRDDKRTILEDTLTETTTNRRLRVFDLSDRLAELNVNAQAAIAGVEDIAEQISQTGGIHPKEFSNPQKFKTGVSNALNDILVTRSNDLSPEQAKMLGMVRDRIDDIKIPKKRTKLEKSMLILTSPVWAPVLGAKAITWDFGKAIWRGAARGGRSQEWRDAEAVAEVLVAIGEEIGNKDPLRSKAAQIQMFEYLRNLRFLAPEETIAEAARKVIKTAGRGTEALNTLLRGPAQPERVTRNIVERRGGFTQPAPVAPTAIPSFATKEEAIAAGVQMGTQVIIAGQQGTLR